MELIKLNEVYDQWETGDGVFTDLNNFDVPWKLLNNVNTLNMTYHGSHSGDKNISPIVYKFLKSEDENARTKLANIIYNMYADKWTKTWGVLNAEYNPLNNYDMLEHEVSGSTVDNTTTHTGTDTVTMTGTDTNTHTGTDTTTNTGTDTTTHDGTNENEVSAFNSANYSDNEKNTIDITDETTHNTTNTETLNLTDLNTRNMTDQTTHNTSEVLDGESTSERTLNRSGNIGITTSQQMAESEIKLRQWLFYQEVFNDIDNILTLSIY